MIDGQKIEVNIAHGSGQGGHRGGREGGSGYHGRLYYQLLEAVRENDQRNFLENWKMFSLA